MPNKRLHYWLQILGLILLLSPNIQAQGLYDHAQLFSPKQRRKLETQVRAFYRQQHYRIIIHTEVENQTTNTANTYRQIHQIQYNDALILIQRNTRKVSLLLSPDLDSLISPTQQERILDYLRPELHREAYFQGLQNALPALENQLLYAKPQVQNLKKWGQSWLDYPYLALALAYLLGFGHQILKRKNKLALIPLGTLSLSLLLGHLYPKIWYWSALPILLSHLHYAHKKQLISKHLRQQNLGLSLALLGLIPLWITIGELSSTKSSFWQLWFVAPKIKTQILTWSYFCLSLCLAYAIKTQIQQQLSSPQTWLRLSPALILGIHLSLLGYQNQTIVRLFYRLNYWPQLNLPSYAQLVFLILLYLICFWLLDWAKDKSQIKSSFNKPN